MKVLISKMLQPLVMGFSEYFVVVIKGLNILHFVSPVAFPWEAKGENVPVMLPQGKWCTSSRETDNQTADVCSKTLCEQDSLNLTSLGPKYLPKRNL